MTDFSGILRTKQGPRIISSVGDVGASTNSCLDSWSKDSSQGYCHKTLALDPVVPEPDSRLESEMLGEQIGNLPMLLYSSVAVQPEYFLDLFLFSFALSDAFAALARLQLVYSLAGNLRHCRSMCFSWSLPQSFLKAATARMSCPPCLGVLPYVLSLEASMICQS